MSIAFSIFLFIFFLKPFSYRMSNETLHHGATSSGFCRRHRGYVFSLHVCTAGPLSTFSSFIHLKHNTGGWFWENLDFVFILSYCLPPTAAQSNHSSDPQRHSKLCKYRCSEQSPLRALGIKIPDSFSTKRRKNCAHDFQPRYPHRKSRRNILRKLFWYAIHFPSILACCSV